MDSVVREKSEPRGGIGGNSEPRRGDTSERSQSESATGMAPVMLAKKKGAWDASLSIVEDNRTTSKELGALRSGEKIETDVSLDGQSLKSEG